MTERNVRKEGFTIVAVALILISIASNGQENLLHSDSLKQELTLASSVIDSMHILLALSDASNTDSGLKYSKQALILAEKSQDRQQIMTCLIKVASLYSRMGKYEEAISILYQAVNIGQNENYSKLLSDSYLELSIAYWRQQKLDSARSVLNRSLALFKGHEEASEGFVHNMLGNVAKEENNFESASAHYLTAVAIFEKYRDNNGLAQSLSNIGNIQYLLGDYDKAETYALQSLEIAKKLNKQSSIAYVTRLLGRVYRKQKRFEEALKNYTLALQVYKKIGERRELCETYTNIGNIHFELEDFRQALVYYSNALKVSRSMKDSVGMAYGLNATAITKHSLGRPDDAILFLDSAMFFANKKRLLPLLMDGYKMKSDIYVERKNFPLAFQNHVLYTNVKDSLSLLRNTDASNELEAKYQNEKKQNEINTLYAENKINALELEKQRTQQIYLIGISLLSAVLIGVLYNRYLIKQRSAEKLKQLDSAKSRFFANISHEFRTPLTLILGPLQKYLSQPDTELPADDIRMIHRNATRLHVLINQLLDLSRIESGKMNLQVEEIDLRGLLLTLCSAFQSQADQRKIDYQVVLQANISSGFCDVDKLEKIIYNLISNAFKFTPDGGRITVDVRKESKLTIQVRDDGVGISMQHIKSIFDRFYQVNDSSTRSSEGTGIGLALARELAEVHHGNLTVTSKEGSGTEFVLTLPVERHQYAPADFSHSGIKPSKTNSSPYALSNSQGEEMTCLMENEERPLILVAEDNHDMRSFIRDILKTDYRIVEAEDGLQAWAKAVDKVPDLVITDVMMPGMDGSALCEKLKDTLATSHIPVVMLTAKAGRESKLDGLHRGADDYLVKPFDVHELKVRVLNLIEQRAKLRKLYRQEITLQPKDIVVTSVDAHFIQKVSAILETEFSHSHFGVEELNKEIGLSRMQLHRKLKALTDQSPGEFIRHFRLEKAKQFLAIKGAQVSQVAYDSGFSNVSHFSKSFKDHTGTTPTEFISSTRVLVYQACEDPNRASTEKSILPFNNRTNQPGKWSEKKSPTRKSEK